MTLLKHCRLASATFVVLGLAWSASVVAAGPRTKEEQLAGKMQVGVSYQNDTSLPLYIMATNWREHDMEEAANEAAENPAWGFPKQHVDSVDPIVQHAMSPVSLMPLPILNFDGQPNGCGCAPPDTNGEVGATQYVQMTNGGVQIFDKTTGASVLGPVSTGSFWAGFGGVCETAGNGDPIVLYDQIAQRWVISQFAGPNITDECIAVSTTPDATGTYNRYGFHLGSDFYDYPHIGVWPDGYYMSDNVFDGTTQAYKGPQPFAFDRAKMLTGAPATFVTTAGPLGSSFAPMLPADLDGSQLPPAGAPNPFVLFPDSGKYDTYRFHVDFATPANSTFTLVPGSPTAAGFTALCTGTRACVPQLGGTGANALDAIADRLMFRLAYRNFGSHESLVGNFTVSSSSVAGIRWFELRNATSGTPTVFQESTYQPDTTWRWMGSTAMDANGNIALGYSASSAAINPQLRYAGRLAGDPLNTLPQAEAHLFDGGGSQTGTGNRWGDYSDLTVDPVDDCTFWFTSEYYAANGQFAWKTRIGNFKFPSCSLAPGFSLSPTPASVSVCAGTPAAYSVAVGSVSGFTNAVTLALAGNPAPSSGTFTPNPVTPGGASALSINTTGVASGTYPMTINGTASGASNQSASINMTVFAAVPGAPSLTAPANGSNGVALRPTFTWSGSNTESYQIDVATDAGFGSIVLTQTVTGTTFTPATDLSGNTTYYWRVTPSNGCGAGTVSPTFSFTTANLICRNPALAITDNSPAGVNDTLVVTDPSGATLTDLKLVIKATHTWVGDLKFTLSKSPGTSTVIDRPGFTGSGFGCSGDNVDVIIDDTAGTLVESQCNATPPALSGNVKPNNPLATAFNGQTLAGTWTLNVSDNASGDTGSLTQWCLVPATSGGTTYTVGGTVGGLSGSGLVLSLNAGAQTLPVAANGAFTFPTGIADGAAYSVTVGTQPTGQTCSVANGSGTVSGANVTNVAVTCASSTYSVGGTVSGLLGDSVTLSLNGSESLPVASDGSFTFATMLNDGASYAVTVQTQPASPPELCTVSNGSGTIAGANVTSVQVSCLDRIFASGFESP
ncbi:proprotein convertase P-domain-containing protein [Dokdonella sp.]|uniref:proprotein convertase P-domain-containing protein n=1 Tax=Dokdonella sp. TaxID=2291710 RepID=UPI002F406CBC